MNYDTINDLFRKISCENYVVLRNYEGFENDQFLADHPDIDILCDNTKKIVSSIGGIPKGMRDDGLHYMVEIRGVFVPIDIRHVGDNYFDKKWEINVLNRRTNNGICNVMISKDYYYTLLYHALIHKGTISSDYKNKLEKLAYQSGCVFDYEKRYELLDAYMRENNYKYTYPMAVTTTAHFSGIDQQLIQHSFLHTFRSLKSRQKQLIMKLVRRMILWVKK